MNIKVWDLRTEIMFMIHIWEVSPHEWWKRVESEYKYVLILVYIHLNSTYYVENS